MNGYTMEEAQRIINNAPVRMILDSRDPDYPALLEIYRNYILDESPIVLVSMAFSLGYAIGIRDERARRKGIRVDAADPRAVELAKQAVKDAEIQREFVRRLRNLDATNKKAILAIAKAMADGKSDEAAMRARNNVLQAAGYIAVPADTIMQR